MNMRTKGMTTIVMCVSVLWPCALRAADQSLTSSAKLARDDAQQLLRDRDEARPKAKAAELKMRDAGLRPESLGFETAREARNQEAASGSKLAAYDRYAKA